MNTIWTTIVIVAMCILTVLSPDKVSDVAIQSAQQALTTAFSMCGVYCLWLSITDILEKSGGVYVVARLMKALTRPLFGDLSEETDKDISMGLSANIIGAGNVATPFNINAMTALTKGKPVLTRSGAMLFVLNATGVQLIPSTVVGLRTSALSANPSDIILPSIICTAVTSLIAVLGVFLFYGRCDT